MSGESLPMKAPGVSVSLQAPELPQLRGLDRPEIIAYLENVRKYDQRAKCWHESRGLPSQPISHKTSVHPTLLDTLKWTGVDIDSDKEIQQWLQATAEVHQDAFRELDKEDLLSRRLEWKWGASNVKGAFLALVTDTASILREAGVYDTVCRGGEWDITKTHGITTGIAKSIGHRQVQSLALTAITNDDELRVNPSSFFAYMIRRITERFPDTRPGRPHGGSSREGKTTMTSGGSGRGNESGEKRNSNKETRQRNRSPPPGSKTCFKCGKPGHVAKHCHHGNESTSQENKLATKRPSLEQVWGERLRPREELRKPVKDAREPSHANTDRSE